MRVIKKSSEHQKFSDDKLKKRILSCSDGLNIDIDVIINEIIGGLYDKVKTDDLEELTQQTCAYLSTRHPDYSILAGRMVAKNLHKKTDSVFSDVIEKLYNYIHPITKENAPLVSEDVYNVVMENKDLLNDKIDYSRDLNFDYFGFMTLSKSYLLKVDGKVAERPQHMFMRVSLGLHSKDVNAAIETYELLSNGMFIHASPTLFNCGTPKPQLSSCFLLTMKDDSIEGIYDTLKTCALISKNAGGIGVSVHNIRASKSYIRGTNGESNGLVPMLRVFNDTARYVDQCFKGDTLVHTIIGPKKIENVKVGDHLLTHKGWFKSVEKVLKYEKVEEDVLEISIDEENKVTVTLEHPFLVISGKIDNPKFDWVDAKDLRVGDYLVTPILKFIYELNQKSSDDFPHKDDYSILEIKSITSKKFTGSLYDFEIKDDHSYVTQIGTVHNGGGKRKGAFSVYLEPWHSDIYEFLELKKNTGKEENRARDLFYALWIPDLFMKKVMNDEDWSLFCPNEAKGLPDVWGDEFEKLYTKYEKEGKARKVIKARNLWFSILDSQIETGTPYMLYKDACNSKSNQQNLGTIKSSNLCTEIIQYTSNDEVAVCNLASVALPKYVFNGEFDHQKLYDVVKLITRNLNRIIDINYYPVKEAENSNKKHRPIGIGIQGLADTFFKLKLAFDSKDAAKLNKEIFETIYFSALTASKDLAKRDGAYESFKGSPASKGILQYDMWNVIPSNRWDWDSLKKEIIKYGLRNSLLLAPMPTASTSQILGNNECFEPITSNIYIRRVLSGEFPVINKYLVSDLEKINLWNPFIINKIIANNGSVQNIEEIPRELKDIYKTVWEIKQRVLMDMAADRGAFIDQSQSLNCFVKEPSYAKLTSMHFYGWKKGLKTGMYYLRTKPAVNAIQFTVDTTQLKVETKTKQKSKKQWVCNNEEGCLMCSS